MARDESYGGWLRGRLRRLSLPVVPLLVVWGFGGWLALQAGVSPELLRMASMVALGPTWFLAAYVLIACLAPLSLRLWERFGWWSVALGLTLAGVSDVMSIAVGIEEVGYLNYVFVWGTVHQLGYAWLDRSVAGAGMALAGLAATFALVAIGPYPVAMVGFGGGELNNTQPPRSTLAFLGIFQAGMVVLLEARLKRLMARARAWATVVLVSTQIMTLYLWHLTAMIILIAAALALDGLGFAVTPFTWRWWSTRPIWLVALAALTALLIVVFGRFERPPDDHRPPPVAWRPVFAAMVICAGLGALCAYGVADEAGLNGLLLALPLVGMMMGGVLGGASRFVWARGS